MTIRNTNDSIPNFAKRRVYSLSDVADTLSVSRQTIYNLHKRGDLRISKILGKSVVFDEDLEAFIEASKLGRT